MGNIDYLVKHFGSRVLVKLVVPTNGLLSEVFQEFIQTKALPAHHVYLLE